MKWEDITQQVIEILNLQESLILYQENKIIKEIINRADKYCTKEQFDIKTLNNAIIEQKIRITPYQLIILKKINDLELDTSIQSVYENMPKELEKAFEYIIKLKDKYELANNSFKLLIDIEKLTEQEYISKTNFDETEYAKKRKNDDKLFNEIKDKIINFNKNVYHEILLSNLTNYINKLSPESKKDLIIETFSLSYDKNAFEYFQTEKEIMKAVSKDVYTLERRVIISKIYSEYQKGITLVERIRLSKMSLQELYDEYKVIYESEIFKQKNLNK